jgi:hypothetical protein
MLNWLIDIFNHQQGYVPLKACNQNIKKAMEIADQMIRLATKGDAEREDAGCGVLYGVILDAAYRIRKMAETERQAHKNKGWWPES